jgi:hypothetical protein
VRHSFRDEEGPIWLEIERLARTKPPIPPKEIGEWIVLSDDPAHRPEAHTLNHRFHGATRRRARKSRRSARRHCRSAAQARRAVKRSTKIRLEAATSGSTHKSAMSRLESSPVVGAVSKVAIARNTSRFAKGRCDDLGLMTDEGLRRVSGHPRTLSTL